MRVMLAPVLVPDGFFFFPGYEIACGQNMGLCHEKRRLAQESHAKERKK